jgi:hypothetical protein
MNNEEGKPQITNRQAMLDEWWKQLMDELAAEEDQSYSDVGDDDDDDDDDARLDWIDFGSYISENDEDSDDEDKFSEVYNIKHSCGRE